MTLNHVLSRHARIEKNPIRFGYDELWLNIYDGDVSISLSLSGAQASVLASLIMQHALTHAATQESHA